MDCIYASAQGFLRAIISLDDGVYGRVDQVGTQMLMPECFVIPRFVDLHAGGFYVTQGDSRERICDRLRTYVTHLASNGLGYALIATVIDNSGAPESDHARLSVLIDCARRLSNSDRCGINLKVHLRCELSDDCVTEILAKLCDDFAPQIGLISAMDHSPGQGQYKDIINWRNAYSYLSFDSQQQLDDLAARRSESARRYYADRLQELAAIANRHSIPFASHDDERTDRQDHAHRLGSSMSEFPLTKVAARRARLQGKTVLVGAPNIVRGTSKFGNISARTLLESDLVDCVSYDYDPSSSLVAWDYICGAHGASAAVALMSGNPARFLGLDGAEIAVGKPANFMKLTRHNGRLVVQEAWHNGVPTLQ